MGQEILPTHFVKIPTNFKKVGGCYTPIQQDTIQTSESDFISLKLHSGEHISSTTEFQNYIALRKKVSVFGVILVRILPYLKIWTRITPNTDTFHAMLISIVKSALMLAVLQMKESSMNFLEVKLNIY